jgi:hypothetical protein
MKDNKEFSKLSAESKQIKYFRERTLITSTNSKTVIFLVGIRTNIQRGFSAQ